MTHDDDGPFLVLSRPVFEDGELGYWFANMEETREKVLGWITRNRQGQGYANEYRVYRISDVLKLPHLRVKPVAVEFEEVAGDE